MFFNIYIALLLLSLIALIWRRKDNEPFFKYLLILLSITIIIELGKKSSIKINSATLTNYYLLFEIVLLSLAYKSTINKFSIKKVINWLIGFSIIFFVFTGYINGLLDYSVLYMSYGHICIILLGIVYLFETYSPPFSNERLVRIPFFWVNTANLFFFTGIFLQLGLDSYISEISEVQAKQLHYINFSLNYLIYILYTIGFLCKKIFK